MTVAYVVIQGENSYDDSWSAPIFTTLDPEKAAAVMADMLSRKVVRDAAADAISANTKAWQEANPMPRNKDPIKQDPLPDYGPKRSKWSAEQIAEYNAVKASNQQRQMDAAVPMSDWARRNYEEILRFTATFPLNVQEDLGTISSRSYWEIVETPFEE